MSNPEPGEWVWDDDAPGDVIVVRAADPGPSVPVETLRGLVAHLRAWGPEGEYATAMHDAADMLEALLP